MGVGAMELGADFETDKFGFYGKVLLQARNGGIF